MSVETVFQDGVGLGKFTLLSKSLGSVMYYVLSMYFRQFQGGFHVLQRPLRNKLQATERYINRSEYISLVCAFFLTKTCPISVNFLCEVSELY